MELLPHIDISEPTRIQALLDDPRNFSWRAVDSETLDTWTPDLGLTAYPQPSVYRAGAVATSGISSTLRHRFWQTIEGQADHIGIRYIGIVIYLAAGESAPMELKLASNVIGRVEPGKGDNRLHLIVVDKPVEFIGEMEIFQLTAPGPGTYRIEHFVLLYERPETGGSKLRIENLSYRLYGRKSKGEYRVVFQFVTSSVCEARIEYEELNYTGPYEPRHELTHVSTGRFHHIVIPDLLENEEYDVTITAIDIYGQSVRESARLVVVGSDYPNPEEVTIPVELINLGTNDIAGLPIRFGLPLAKGLVYKPGPCVVEVLGVRQLASMYRTSSCWEDDSLRWVLLETDVPIGLEGAGAIRASVCLNADADPSSVYVLDLSRPVDDQEGLTYRKVGLRREALGKRLMDDRAYMYLDFDRGDYRIKEYRNGRREKMSLSDLAFDITLGNGLRLSTRARDRRQLMRTSLGSTNFDLDHVDGDGIPHLRSNIQLQFYRGQTFFKLHHRLEVISPALAPAAAGGELPPECDDDMRANIVGDSGEESTLLKLRSFALHIPFVGAKIVNHAGEAWQLDGGDWQLRHDHDLAHEINGDIRDGRAPGHIIVDGDAGALGIGLRNFWQTYPKAITVGSGGIDIGLFPERRGRDLPGDEDAPHRLYFWLDEDGYKLKAGMALSSEILIDFGGDNPAVFDWLENPVLVRPDIGYLNSTGALNPIGAREASPLPDYDALTDRAIDSFYQDREHFRAYGQVNFGDWYGESAWSWGNNEYDPSYCAYTEFLRGGDPRWARLAAEAARHLADVDTVNFSSDEGEIGGQSMHMPGHLGGYLPPYFRSKMGGTKSIPSHTWVEGPLLHYLLTGDEAVYDSLLKTKDWLLQRRFFDYYDFSNAREAGWHLIHLCALADSLDDADCLNAAGIIVERVLQRQEPEGGWVRNLGEPHCGCGYPRCRGEAGFMVGVLLSGLKRYHHLTGDDAVAGAIIGGARWLIRHTFDEASGHFRYTSCPNRTLGGTFQHTQYVLEALASAWELSGDPEIGTCLRAGLPTIGMFPGDLDHLGLGKALSQQMRYVPTIIAALERRSLESVEATND